MLIDILFINHFTRSYRDKNVKARPVQHCITSLALHQSVSDSDYTNVSGHDH